MKPSFVGRETELLLLDRLWARPEATLLILYGRRRVGKTRLLTYWLRQGDAGETGQEQAARRVLYWVAEPSSARDQLRSFSQAVYNFAVPQARAGGFHLRQLAAGVAAGGRARADRAAGTPAR